MSRIFLILFSLFGIVFARSNIIVGIAGGTGSGKTTLAEKLHKAFPGSILISQDSYYKDQSHLPMHEREKTNFDHPDSLEFSLLIQHLSALKNNQTIKKPNYDFAVHTRCQVVDEIKPAQIVIVEGILIFAVPELRNIFDLKIFVATDDDVRILRRIERDIKERHRTLEGVIARYLDTVKPMHEAFVEPSKKYADIIIPEGGHNEVALDVILSKLAKHVR